MFYIYNNSMFLKASLIVHDIPDLQWDRGELGSVVFSESFLESSINIQQRGTVQIRFEWIADSICKGSLIYIINITNPLQITANIKSRKSSTVITVVQKYLISSAMGCVCCTSCVCHSLACFLFPHVKHVWFFSCRWHCVLRQLLHHLDCNSASLCLLAGMCGTECRNQNQYLK